MKRKISSKFFMLALAVSVLGVFSANNVWGQSSTPDTSTTVDNVAPTITAVQDASNGTTPTDVDDDTTWTFTVHDDNNDDLYVVICSSNAYTAGSLGSAPTCTGTTWATSAQLTTDGSGDVTDTLTRTALIGDAESNDWYVILCDNNSGGRLCAAASGVTATNGQGDGTDDSPFKVNHRSTFASWTVDDVTNNTGNNGIAGTEGVIEPGETVQVSATVTDSDSDTAQDTVKLFVCENGDTAGGTYTTPTCSTKQYCVSVGAVPGSHSCTFGASESAVPIAHGSYDVDVYVIDSHNFISNTTIDQSWSVNDVSPYIVDANAYSVSDITLSAGASTAKQYTVTVKDDNGDTDLVDTATGYIYDKDTITLSSGACTPDENDCYSDSVCSLSGNADYTTRGSGVAADYEATATCDFTVWYNANDTASGTLDWRLHVNPVDGTAAVTDRTDSNAIQVNALSALATTETSIPYGTVGVGSSNSTARPTTIENAGNQIIDVLIDGTNMTLAGYSGSDCATDTDCIPAGQQEWSQSSSFSHGAGYDLVLDSVGAAAGAETAGCSNRDLAVRTDHTSGSLDEVLYWKILIPSTVQSGTYTGTNTLVTTSNTSCSGTN